MRASTVLTVCASPPLSGSDSTTTERAPIGATMARSAGSAGSPVRHTSRVGLPPGMRPRRASSMSTLSRRASTTTAASRRLALAAAISPSRSGRLGDQPSTSVCPDSMTRERPLRSSTSHWSRPVAMRPMSADSRNSPLIVMTSEMSRKVQPVSPVKVPASNERPSASHMRSPNEASPPTSSAYSAAPATTSSSAARAR